MGGAYKTYRSADTWRYLSIGNWVLHLIIIGIVLIGIVSFVPQPFKIFVVGVVLIALLIFVGISIIVSRFVGTKTELLEEEMRVRSWDSLLLDPGKNEMYVYFYRSPGAIAKITYTNIESVRKISDEEIKEVRKAKNSIFRTLRVAILSPANYHIWAPFVTQYSNIVEIMVKSIGVPDFSGANTKYLLSPKAYAAAPKIQQEHIPILVSVGDADDFVREVSAKILTTVVP